MKFEIYDYHDYREFLRMKITTAPKAGHGLRSKLAKAIGCQTAYLSRILSGEAHLSLEQGVSVNQFFSATKQESHFFLLMIQMNRAGTIELQKYFKQQMDLALKERSNFKNRIQIKESINENEKTQYYSEWYYAAIHMIVTIPELQTPPAIAERLKISELRVQEALEFLCSISLVVKKNGRFTPSIQKLHLSSDSPLISKHHSNWRLKTIQSLERNNEDLLHYSSVITCSYEDSQKIRSIMLRSVDEIRAIVSQSVGESLFSYNLDLFEL